MLTFFNSVILSGNKTVVGGFVSGSRGAWIDNMRSETLSYKNKGKSYKTWAATVVMIAFHCL